MYSMDDLLHLVHSESASELKLQVGQPPVLILDSEKHPLEGPAITSENAEQLLQSIADTRQRRILRKQGVVKFIYRFRGRVDFFVQAKIDGEDVSIVIQKAGLPNAAVELAARIR
jgi:Tfp pilus assembly ATPase PilU